MGEICAKVVVEVARDTTAFDVDGVGSFEAVEFPLHPCAGHRADDGRACEERCGGETDAKGSGLVEGRDDFDACEMGFAGGESTE